MECTTVESARSGQVMDQVPKSVVIDIFSTWTSADEQDEDTTRLQKQDIINGDDDELCEGCMVSNTSVKPFPKSKHG
ncbi:hypothetical protein PsorP6_001031 [Peronosclerospora sorghi]|uniref:Uncharacterized protein n=1 Tax=Peronosclerospora sorghi TaxID=230839 RepID=A0ACC0WR14_9STRA|nr:hypothetical protein PsorP6_001031 [Peronosclerospora sorghi]